MAPWEDGGEFYGFVEAAPPRSGARDNVVFDAVEIQGFDHGRGEEEGSLCIVRVMSTRERLRTLFQIEGFAEGQWYRLKLNHHPRSYHESLDNLTPVDVYTVRGAAIQLERQCIKRQTLMHRRLQHIQNAA